MNVIRRLIEDTTVESIGGEVQLGYSTPLGGFRRVASVVPDRGQEPKASRVLNAIDIDDLGDVGPCAIGMDGMVTP